MDSVRKAENFVYQNAFALDFDGTISINEFLERAEYYEIEPAFIYETLTCSAEIYKFRTVFVIDITVEDKCAAEIMIQLLLKLFPEADPACKDVARKFFGWKKEKQCGRLYRKRYHQSDSQQTAGEKRQALHCRFEFYQRNFREWRTCIAGKRCGDFSRRSYFVCRCGV